MLRFTYFLCLVAALMLVCASGASARVAKHPGQTCNPPKKDPGFYPGGCKNPHRFFR